MARDHARIKVNIWQGKEFRSLTALAQHTYLLLVSHPQLSYAGVIDYFPGRFAAMSKDATPAKIDAAIKQLERTRFVVVDRDTSELAVRTYVRHDGVLDRKNMGKATCRALMNVVSLDIRASVITELARLHREQPGLSGWDGIKELDAMTYDEVTAMASAMPLRIASGM